MDKPRVTVQGKVTKEYVAYKSMIARCQQTMPSWKKKYGGTVYDGMEIEEAWLAPNGFEIFYVDLGPAFEGAYIDRIDNSKGYVRGNVKWSTTSESNMNKRNARLITAFGKTQNLAEWSRETGLREECIARRLTKYGYSPEKALTTAVGESNRMPKKRAPRISFGYKASNKENQ